MKAILWLIFNIIAIILLIYQFFSIKSLIGTFQPKSNINSVLVEKDAYIDLLKNTTFIKNVRLVNQNENCPFNYNKEKLGEWSNFEKNTCQCNSVKLN